MDKVQLETLLKENPAAIAAVQKMTAVKLQGKGKRKVQATTALKDKDHPSHQKAVGIFQKLKDKFSKKKEDEPKKQSQSDADFYKKQYAARTGKELRRTEMEITEDILRRVIREEIKNIINEDDKEAFKQPIPATIDRFMKKFISAINDKNLNRKRKLAILGRVVVALRLDPSEVSKYARLVKKEL